MPNRYWSRLLSLMGAVPAVWGSSLLAFQDSAYSPDDLNGQYIHGPDAWNQMGFRSDEHYQKSPADFGPITGMAGRAFGGGPADGEQFPIMQPGPLPGGMSQWGFNGSGMWPPVNQPQAQQNMPFDPSRGPINPAGFPFAPGLTPVGSQTLVGPNMMPQGGAPKSSEPRPIRAQVSSSQAPYVGLIGQMARPGSYEIVPGQSTLSELIERIGGLTKGASGQLRIIRNGRPGQSIAYSPAMRFELFSGDVIIADTLPSNSTPDPRVGGPLSARPVAAQTAANGFVQIGFINLLDRPVVLKLRDKDANVAGLLAMLRQDAALASQINVVLPVSYRFPSAFKPDDTLPSEAVLIFPRNAIAADRLVALPEPYSLKQQQNLNQAVPDPHAGANPSSQPEPANPVPVDSANAARTPQFIPDRVSRDSQLAPAPPADDAGHANGKSLSRTTADRDSANAPEPPAAIPSATREPQRLDTSASNRRRPIGLTSDAQLFDDLEGDQHETTVDSTDDVAAAKSKASSVSIWLPLTIAGGALMALIGYAVALRWRNPHGRQLAPETHRSPKRSVDRPVAAVPQSASARRDVLDAMIQNQMPVAQQPVKLSSPLQFHGRPLPPKYIRVDNRHEIPPPHTPNVGHVSNVPPVRTERQVGNVPHEAPATRAAVSEKDFRSAATVANPPTMPPTPVTVHGPLDRALFTVQQRGRRA